MPKDFLQGASLTPTFEALMVKFGGKIGTLYQMLKNAFKKHPLQNRTNVQIKGGGVKGLLNNVKKNCTFLKGRLPLAQFRSHTLMWFLNNLRLSQVEKKSRQKLEQGLTFHLHLLYLNFALLPPIPHICHNHHIQNWV